jgi:hypothetical protein
MVRFAYGIILRVENVSRYHIFKFIQFQNVWFKQSITFGV